MNSEWRLRSWFAVCVAVVLTSACGGSSDETTPTAVQAMDASSPAASAPIAEADAVWDGHVTELLALERIDEGTLELRFAIVNNRAPEEAPTVFGDALAQAPGDEGSVADVHLIDSVGQKKYFVLRDQDGRAICSHDLEPLASGARVELWARFPAPAADTTSVDVFVPQAPLFVNVPIPPAPADSSATP